jgi:hypothetical protein
MGQLSGRDLGSHWWLAWLACSCHMAATLATWLALM